MRTGASLLLHDEHVPIISFVSRHSHRRSLDFGVIIDHFQHVADALDVGAAVLWVGDFAVSVNIIDDLQIEMKERK